MNTNKKNWKLIDSKIPHQPFHIVNESGEMVCTVFQSKYDFDYALAIQNLPRFKKLLKMVLEYDAFTKDENSTYPLEEELFRLAKQIDRNKYDVKNPHNFLSSVPKENPKHFDNDLVKLLKDHPLEEIPIEKFKNK